MIKGVVLVVKSPDVKCVNLCLTVSDSFHSHATNKEYKINFSFNCDSSNVVYLLDCVVCGFQYVGSTSTLFRLRFNN